MARAHIQDVYQKHGSFTYWQEEAQRRHRVCFEQTETSGVYLHTDMMDVMIRSFLFA